MEGEQKDQSGDEGFGDMVKRAMDSGLFGGEPKVFPLPEMKLNGWEYDMEHTPLPADFRAFDSPIRNPNTLQIDYTVDKYKQSLTLRSRAHFGSQPRNLRRAFDNRIHIFFKDNYYWFRNCLTLSPEHLRFHWEIANDTMRIGFGEDETVYDLTSFIKFRINKDWTRPKFTWGLVSVYGENAWKGSKLQFWRENGVFMDRSVTVSTCSKWGLFYTYKYEFSWRRFWEAKGVHLAFGVDDTHVKFGVQLFNKEVAKWWKLWVEELKLQLGYKFENGSLLGVEAACHVPTERWVFGLAGKARVYGDTFYYGGVNTAGKGWVGLSSDLGDGLTVSAAADLEAGRRSTWGGPAQAVSAVELKLTYGKRH